MDIEQIFKTLKKKSEKENINHVKKYMKSNLDFFAVRNSELRKIAKQIYKENKEIPYDLLRKLWKTKNSEAMSTSLDLIELYKKIYDDKTWDTINKMSDDIENWGHCDKLCSIRGEFWQRKDFLTILSKWTKSDNLWKRRSAAVSLLARRPLRIPFSFEKTIKILNPIIYDNEYFVQKGVGWMLKVLYQQYPKQTFDYLLKRKDGSRVMLRTACEKMPKTKRDKVLFEK